jgi:hypothetical protein
MPKICDKQLNQMIENQNDVGSKAKSLTEIQSSFNFNLINFIKVFKKKQNFSFFGIKASANSNKNVMSEHKFVIKEIYEMYRPILKCDVCLLQFENEKSYASCTQCRLNVHLKCRYHVKNNCKPIENFDDCFSDDPNSSIDLNNNRNDLEEKNALKLEPKIIDKYLIEDEYSNSNRMLKSEVDLLTQEKNQDVEMKEELVLNKSVLVTSEETDVSRPLRSFKKNNQAHRSKNIGVYRVSQKFKKTSGSFWTGHMYYFTSDMPQFVIYYWKLDSQSIVVYDTYKMENQLKLIMLESIKSATLCSVNRSYSDNQYYSQKCIFMLKTDKETYYCGNRDEDENAPLNVLARTFYNIFKMVYMPYNANNRLKVKKFMFSVPRYEENSLQDKYVLNPSQLLGSGQFGQVYAGIRKEDNTPVAIKVIEKSRFKDFRFENNVFQNEITILYNIEHPGILKLLSLFDQTDHVKI